MPKVDDETLRKRFEKAKEAWEERQKTNRAKQRLQKTQDDARRRDLIGGIVLARTQHDPLERERLMKDLDANLKNPKDRALFDLGPRPEAPVYVASEGQPSLVDTANT